MIENLLKYTIAKFYEIIMRFDEVIAIIKWRIFTPHNAEDRIRQCILFGRLSVNPYHTIYQKAKR